MKKTIELSLSHVVVAASLTFAAVVWAGNLNPPAGAVQGTMVTLDEIHGAIIQTNTAPIVEARGAEFGVAPQGAFVNNIPASINGVLHKVILSSESQNQDGALTLRDGTDVILGSFSTGFGAEKQREIILNARFQNGIDVLVRDPSTGYSLLYIPDSP